MTPLVSVVIPTYNRARDLLRALTSVVEQTCTNWEALIIDNHSIDNTKEVVAGFHDQRMRYFSVHNHGVIAVSRNLGVASAQGTFVAFLDSDDWWSPRKLERSLEALAGGADIVYHDLWRVRSEHSRWLLRRARTQRLASPIVDTLLEAGNVLTNSSVVVRRAVLLDAGGLSEDPRLAAWEDYDCWLRIAKVTEAFRRIAEPLGYYCVGGGNMSTPQRTITNLQRLRELCLAPAGRRREEDLPGWYHYAMGRAYYHLDDHRMAQREMILAMHGRLFPAVRLKALLTVCASTGRRWVRAIPII
jgi:glycosyltransferase involved in cell wall biosynthesis